MAFWPFKTRDWATRGVGHSSDILRVILSNGRPKTILLRDNDYRCISLKDFRELMDKCRYPEPKYVKEIFDCEQYTICFMADMYREWARQSNGEEALAFGYIEVELENNKFHAIIWQLDDSGKINYIEPQTNDIFKGKIMSVRLIEG